MKRDLTKKEIFKIHSNMTAEELIEILKKFPKDANIFVSGLCHGWIDEESIEYEEDTNTISFR
jgi:hypothetical protein